jgi:CBS domain-containing protein
MHAIHVMTRDVVAVTPHTTIEEAAKIMLRMHISGLPVIDDAGNLVGMVSESDFLRRSEIGTGRRHAVWLTFFMGPGRAAAEFIHERGRKVADVMTRDVITVQEETSLSDIVALMEKHDIKRVPVMRGKSAVGIVTRSNLLQAMASLAHEIPDPTGRRRAHPRTHHQGCRSHGLAPHRLQGHCPAGGRPSARANHHR